MISQEFNEDNKKEEDKMNSSGATGVGEAENGKAQAAVAKASRDVVDLGKTAGQSPGNGYTERAVGVREHLVDVHEMARILDVNEDWLYQRTRMNPPRIPCVRVGRNLRFEPQVVLAFIREKGASLV